MKTKKFKDFFNFKKKVLFEYLSIYVYVRVCLLNAINSKLEEKSKMK